MLGYFYGHQIKPNRQLRRAIQTAKEACAAAMQQGNRGVYRTVITDHNQTSELTVEVEELAVTQAGQVKVTFHSAFYKNPEFRTKKGEALLREVRELLGDYLPANEIEWFERTEKQNNITRQQQIIDNLHQEHFGV
ncbi:hypothetical protein D1627_07445 [Pontibacter oryzae]|uniref:Uncharacterized protein n=1 Tax=Pontibacter oryzae TaxID=2304593 RepID=A0A399SFX8_9BACT|nr:hypothetical protein D1627_07445 [Pontibacter oryzae]